VRALDAAEPARRDAAVAAAERMLADARATGARARVVVDADYPARLLDLVDPPPVLWAVGDDGTLRAPVVAIVGTRRASAYGERVTRELAGALARAGAAILSGMARGIDAAAHRAALDAPGRTAAVLGTGVDIAYPAAHRALHAEIGRTGLLLSELPPGDHAGPGSFPSRNRIIAALADVVLVVEAGRKSGALITAAAALELGRTVAAVPGPIDDARCEGSNELLRDGAVVIASVEDALALAGLTAPPRGPGAAAGTDERAVWDALGEGPADMDTLAARSRLPARRCLAAVSALEIAGSVECALTGEVRRR
jgi:DNA processing protein